MKIDSPTFISETTFISASVQFSSGSQKFGDTTDDTHQFTGSLSISGSSISLGDANNNVVIGNNVTSNVRNSLYSTYIGYQAAGGNTSTAIGGQSITVVGWPEGCVEYSDATQQINIPI